MTTSDQREEARYRQDVLGSYRAWLAFLEAQQTLLATAGEGESGGDPFEGLSGKEERAAAARQRLAGLPADKRELFEAVLEGERQQVQRELDAQAPVRGGTLKRPDPDEVARRALARLHEEARGLHRPDRRGMLPRGKPDALKWLAIDLTDLAQAPPSETDYQLAAGSTLNRRRLLVNLGLAAASLLSIPLVLLLLQQPGASATSVGLPTANGAALSPWPVTAISAGSGDWTLPVEAVTTVWPEMCATGTSGCWLRGSLRPLRICLPAERLANLATLQVDAGEGLPMRTFTLGGGAGSEGDLLVQPCGDAAAEAEPLVGRLQTVALPPELAPGEAAPAGFRLSALTAEGRGADPTLAQGSLRLSVILHDADTNRDWGALAPTVLLADGTVASPSGATQDGEARRLFYLVPDQSEPFDVRWQVTLADQVVRYRATLEPPPSRDTVLRTALRVELAAVSPSEQTMAVRLALTSTATTPLVVEQADLGFQTSAGRRELAAPTLRQPLLPDERRILTLDLPLETGVLEVGPFRFELSVRR